MYTSAYTRPLSAALVKVAPFAVAILAGCALLWITGFAPLPAVHDAVHDVRHAAGFPCH
ncbi:MAG: CbtB-domain containing protein [Nitrospirota bacterium]|nr:CbtB-domain containing protein [Nitrospirota bacterium]